jgi:two-component system, cell cycle sensor histidine kinase and response regulator CckA
MKNKQDKWFEQLRQMADREIKKRPAHVENIGPADLTRLIDEIQVFQVELELQNEELRSSLEELEKSRSRFSRLFDMAPAGYVVLDDAGMILHVNQTLMNMLKKSPDALLGKPFSRFIAPEDQGIFLSRFTAIYRHPEDKTIEVRLVSDHRFVSHARLQGGFIPFESEPGEPDVDQFCLIVTDITERKQAEKRILHLQKTESLGRMAGAMAHHYNNLLTTVMGNLEMALEDLPGDSRVVDNLEQAMAAAERISKLGTTMLAYLGQTNTPRKRLDLSETCRTAVSSFPSDLPPQIFLETDFPVPGPAILANADEIRQILNIFITNAREAMEDRSGAIVLGIHPVLPGDIPARHRYPVDFQPGRFTYAGIRIQDAGPGIPKNALEKIFDPFYSTRFTGRGLGLPIALGTVKSLGGCITVTTTPGTGTVFQVFVPMIDANIPA